MLKNNLQTIQTMDLLARSIVGRYRLGQEKTSLFLAGSLFEGLINSKFEEQGYYDENMPLFQKIFHLNDLTIKRDSLFKRRNVFTNFFTIKNNGKPKFDKFSNNDNIRIDQVKERLQNFKNLRNCIMHDQMSKSIDTENTINDLICYLWSEFSPDSFEKALKNRKENEPLINTIYEHTADYMIRAVEEVESIVSDEKYGDDIKNVKLYSADFDNLFVLRRKLVPLKNYISKWLKTQAEFLKTDILTKIDTTSAYIWMPLVPIIPRVRSTKTKEKRIGVYDCSVSILATPHDLRIYMDFGGYDREQRKMYFDFLSDSPEYEKLLVNLKNKMCFEVFDIDWYSYISNRQLFSDWLLVRNQRLLVAKDKLNAFQEDSPITWNRCLHGYIFSKLDLGDKFCIDLDMIEQQLKDIILFYQAFQQYKERTETEGVHV